MPRPRSSASLFVAAILALAPKAECGAGEPWDTSTGVSWYRRDASAFSESGCVSASAESVSKEEKGGRRSIALKAADYPFSRESADES